MSPRSALLGALLGCTATLDFDVARLPSRDAMHDASAVGRDVSAADIPPADVPAADVPAADMPVADAPTCPAGTRDCGGGGSLRCRACCENAHCDDNNGCTTDRCGGDGRCVHTGCEGNRVCCDNARCCVGTCAGRCA